MRPLQGEAEPLICAAPPRKEYQENLDPTKDHSPIHPTKDHPPTKDNPQAIK